MTKSSLRPSAALAALLAIQSAHAATYTFNGTNTANTTWSSGTNWSGVPVSATDTSIVLGGGASLADNIAVTSAQNTASPPFQLNSLTMSYAGPATAVTTPSVTINGSSLRFVSNGGTTPTINLNQSGTVRPTLTIASAVTFANDTTIGGNNDVLFSGTIANSGGAVVTKGGTGIMRVQSNNSGYTGNFTVSGGSLQVGNNGGAGDIGNGTVTLAGGGLTFRRNGGTLALNNTITGTGSVTFQTNGGFIATINRANTYVGTTSINPTAANVSGTVQLGINNGLSTSSVLSIGNNGASVQTFGLNNFNQTLGGLSTNSGGNATNSKVTLGTGTLTINDASNRAFAGEISGAGNVTKQGAGNWTLSGANTYSGITTISAGTLTLSGSGTFGTSTVTGSGGTINLGGKSITNTVGALTGGAQIINGTFTNNSGTYDVQSGTMGTVLSGTNVLTKTGAGTVTLNSANTYSGNTTISAGTLALGASGTFANSPVINLGTVGSPGTLDLTTKSAFAFGTSQTVSGNGTINIGNGKTVTINGGLAPGNSPGITSVIGNLTMAPTTDTTMEIISRTGAAGTAFDQVSVTGTLTFDGDLFIDTTGLTGLVANDSFFLFSAGTYGAAGLDSVSISGTVYNPGALTNALGTWTVNDIANNLTFTFTEADGLLTITAIPEPSAYAALAGIGMIGFALYRRRHQRKAA
jgi:autotransporter-associated beta strand protein